MKLYLDDERKAPFGWERAKTARECIDVLAKGGVEELSLDHDLAEEHYASTSYSDPPRTDTGYAVVRWMVENNVWPARIILHTMNPVGRENMRATIARHAPEHVNLEIRVGWRGGSEEWP